MIFFPCYAENFGTFRCYTRCFFPCHWFLNLILFYFILYNIHNLVCMFTKVREKKSPIRYYCKLKLFPSFVSQSGLIPIRWLMVLSCEKWDAYVCEWKRILQQIGILILIKITHEQPWLWCWRWHSAIVMLKWSTLQN